MEVAPKRILYVITKSNWGGAQRYVYDLAVAAREAGHEVLVAAGGDGELLTRLGEAKVPVRSLEALGRDVRLSKELAAFKELRALIQEFRPDVVHLNSSKAGIAALAARLSHVPHIIFTVHGWAWNEDRPLIQKAIIAFIYWMTLILSQKVIVVSEAARKQARFLPFVQRKFVVIHNGVRPLTPVTRQEARARLLPHSNRPLWIGTIAELHPIKGLPTLIEATKGFSDTEVVIMGEGQDRARLEELIARAGTEHIHLLGHVKKAAEHLLAFDIFILPSHSEGLAYVLLEAGQASLATIASNVGGIPEIVNDGKTGLLVPSGDAKRLRLAIDSLRIDPARRHTLGEALHAKVGRDFSLDQMLARTFALY